MGQFSLYGYKENFENILLKNYCSDFKVISQGRPLQNLCK